MPDFFLIAGLFLARTIDKPLREFLDKKVAHFAYFYVLWLVIQAGVKLPGLALHDPLAFARELGLAFLEPFGTLWFIYLLPVLFLAARLVRRVPPAVTLIGFAALQVAGVHTGWIVIDEFCGRAVYFMAGWLLAPRVFDLARAAAARPGRAVIALEVWASVNAAAVMLGWAALPGVSLALGAAGACAVVVVSALLARMSWTAPLAYLGRHSLIVYLAFFLPMAATRMALLRAGLIEPLGPLDVGTASALITVVAVAVPLALHAIVRDTRLGVLFARPRAFRLR